MGQCQVCAQKVNQVVQDVAQKTRVRLLWSGILDKQVGKDGDSKCPSCRRLNEMVDHLNQCQSEVKSTVLVDQIALI